MERRMIENLERYEDIVLGLDQECWNANALEKELRGLGFIIVVGAAETERRTRDLVVEFIDRRSTLDLAGGETAGGDHSASHAFEKAPFVDAVRKVAEFSGASS